MLNLLSKPLSKIQYSKIPQIFVSVGLVLVLLFSMVSHGEHYSLGGNDSTHHSAEQNCHLCQQYIDNLDNDVEIEQQLLSRYYSYLPKRYLFTFHSNNSISPPLRAPPRTY